jgi:propionate CoA-transferase
MQIITAKQAADVIKNDSAVAFNGFIMAAAAEEIIRGIEERFLNTGEPSGLTIVSSTSVGDAGKRGLNHLAHKGLIKRLITGHLNLMPKLQKMIVEESIEAYNFPQGVMSMLMRDIAGRRPGHITQIGLHTFVDPRISGGKLNARTKEDLNEIIQIGGKDYIRYKPFKVDYAVLRGTYSDARGNISMGREAAWVDALSMAQACRASGGRVFVQVEKIVDALSPHEVRLPSVLVDYVIPVSNPANHKQSANFNFNPAYVSEDDSAEMDAKDMPTGERYIIAARAANELMPGAVINLGIGIPEGIAQIAGQRGNGDFTLTVEAGGIGGYPMGGLDFGCTFKPEAILWQHQQFEYYHGGGLNQAFLGIAEVDPAGNINVSRFGPRVAGCGGFICITQSTPRLYFMGTFTAKGLKTHTEGGRLVIDSEGSVKKFKKSVEQVTFSANYARESGQQVLLITERCVFILSEKGLLLTEIAPGIDLETHVLPYMEFTPVISRELKLMDPEIFK